MRSLKTPVSILSLAALLALLLSACRGTPTIQTLRIGDPPFADGEVARYQVTAEGEPPATAIFETVARVNAAGEPDGWTLRRQVDGRGITEIVVTNVGPVGMRPVDATMVRVLPDGTEQVRATFNGPLISLELTTRQNVTTYEDISMPSDVREQRTLPWIVRTLPLEQGYAAQINALMPITGNMDRVTISVGRPESVTVPAGTFDAYNISLDTGDSLSRIWVGVDAPHPVIKYQDARAGAEYQLESFTPGE